MLRSTPRLASVSLVPTHILHRAPSAVYSGPHASSRAALDYTWHTHYTPARQAVQDGIISAFLDGGCVSERPWLCLTAGAMGAGKSRTVRWLHAEGIFPLHRFVVVEADRVKSLLPEMPAYVRENRRLAGTLLHRESCFIAEILEREAIARSKNVLVDSSLRDAHWYDLIFRGLRAARPHYRIAILMVTAPAETVYARVARRAAVTGRDVPREVLNDAMARVPRSFARLAPLADYAAVIRNDVDDESPELVSEEVHDPAGGPATDCLGHMPSPSGERARSSGLRGDTNPWIGLKRRFADCSTCTPPVDEASLEAKLQVLLDRSHLPSERT